jgi:hemoglobin-like flavoprotein
MNIDLIEQTFHRAKAENGGLDALGHAFYERLFRLHPEVRSMFKHSTAEQQKKLMGSISTIVGAAKYPDRLLPFLKQLGVEHVGFKTRPEHYPVVAENLIAVLEAHLSVEGVWTAEMTQAWEETLNTIAQVMMTSSRDFLNEFQPLYETVV